MTKKFNKSIFYTILTFVLLSALALTFFLGGALLTPARADTPSTTSLNKSAIKVEILNRDEVPQPITLADGKPYEGGTAFTSAWSNSSRFVISYVPSRDQEPPFRESQDDPTAPEYTLSLKVEYLKAYLTTVSTSDSGWGFDSITLTNPIQSQTLLKYINDDDSSPFNSFAFNIDEGLSGTINNEEKTASGWGIYKFTIDINGAEAVSDYYFIEPTGRVDANLRIKILREDEAIGSLHKVYTFTLADEVINASKYIDQNNLVWYVVGNSYSGERLCLLPQDKNHGTDMADCTGAIINRSDYPRTGLEFSFDDNEHSGDWEVWCEYNYEGDTTTTAKKSNVEPISTGTPYQSYVIYYIIGAVALAAIIVVIVIAVVKKKKEKVW